MDLDIKATVEALKEISWIRLTFTYRIFFLWISFVISNHALYFWDEYICSQNMATKADTLHETKLRVVTRPTTYLL